MDKGNLPTTAGSPRKESHPSAIQFTNAISLVILFDLGKNDPEFGGSPCHTMKVIERLLELQELESAPKTSPPAQKKLTAEIRADIPAPILSHYDRLRQHGRRGVALVRHGVCGGCRMKLASGANAKLLRDDDICMCENCGSYLLAPAPAEPVAENNPPPAPRKTTRKSGGRRRRPEE